MQIIQPHYHGIARTAQDYERMAMSGVVAVAEPAFWAGFDRRYPETFIDYFRQISEFEPTRAADYGIRHFCWVAVNPEGGREPGAEPRRDARTCPSSSSKPTVLGVGEIGLHKSTTNEVRDLRSPGRAGDPTRPADPDPHAAPARQGPRHAADPGDPEATCRVNPDRVWIDHVEEHTIREPLDAGYWVGFTLYPITKCSPKRAVDMLETLRPERMLVNSSADWGPSDPFTLQECVLEFRGAGIRCRRRSRSSTTTPAGFSGRTRSSTSRRSKSFRPTRLRRCRPEGPLKNRSRLARAREFFGCGGYDHIWHAPGG